MANEKRLIDAKAFHLRVSQKKMNDVFPNWKELPQETQDAVCEHGQYLQMLLETQSTVDAVEVVHGHWISLTDCANAGVYCSVCNKKVYKEDYAWCNRKNKLRSNYCPNCGAKMDGDGNG